MAAWLSPSFAVAACRRTLGSSPAGEAVSGGSVSSLPWLLWPQAPPEPFPPPWVLLFLRCWVSPAAVTVRVMAVTELDTSVVVYNLPGASQPSSHSATPQTL